MLKSSNELKPNTKISKIRTIIKIKTYGIIGSSLMLIIGFLIFGILMIMSYFNIEINSNINNFFITL